MEFKEGDIVESIVDEPDGNGCICVGSTGTVVKVDYENERVGICWHEDICGHSLDGDCEDGHGWWVNFCDVALVVIEDFELSSDEEMMQLLFGQ